MRREPASPRHRSLLATPRAQRHAGLDDVEGKVQESRPSVRERDPKTADRRGSSGQDRKGPTEQIIAESVRPAAERQYLLEAFVTDLLKSGIAVEFFLPPPNPWLFEEAPAFR